MFIALASQHSTAEAHNGVNPVATNPFFYPVPPLPPELGFAYHHASTAFEGALRGQAQRLHAAGNYWLAVSQALVCREQARALALANRQRWVDYRTGMRTRHESERERRIAEQRRVNEARRPLKYSVYRLTADQLDQTTGAIAWPTVLRNASYDNPRGRLDELFRDRAGYSKLPIETSAEIARCAQTFRVMLQRDLKSIRRDEYLSAQKFLCGLKYEPELERYRAASHDERATATTASGHRRVLADY
jgi:hypothetical protein